MAKRRYTAFRTAEQRAKLWNKKMDANVYAVYLERTKPLVLDRVEWYQHIHEMLISMVREVLSKYPDESVRQHAYVWFAQGIWYITHRYRDRARQREANALYIYWRALGLKDEPLREIAKRLGVDLDPIETIIVNYFNLQIGGITSEQVYQGAKQAIEETIEPILKDLDIKTNPVHIDIEYNTNKNISRMVILDKITGETRTITFEYDTEGYLVSIDES